MSEILAGEAIRVHFAGVKAVDGVDIELPRGEIVGLIGPNGAGKTTLLNVLTGFQRATDGCLTLSGRDATSWPPERMVRHGVARTFQSGRLFARLTVSQNVEAAAVSSERTRARARALTSRILEHMGIADLADVDADALPHGSQRRLGIARALATRPRFLLLDEPGAGLNESESTELDRSLRHVRDEFELGVILIEHDMRLIMSVSDRIQVLDHGKTISVGTPAEIRADQQVIAAYLGPGVTTSPPASGDAATGGGN